MLSSTISGERRESCAPCRSRGRGRRGIRVPAPRVSRRGGAQRVRIHARPRLASPCASRRRTRRRCAVRRPAPSAMRRPPAPRRDGSMNSETRMPAPRKLGDERLEVIVPADDVEAAFGGALGALFRHQAAGVRPDAQARCRASARSPPSRNSAAWRSPPSAARMSSSRIWRRSSRRCAVMPSAPASIASSAARTGSGTAPPRALRTVAT